MFAYACLRHDVERQERRVRRDRRLRRAGRALRELLAGRQSQALDAEGAVAAGVVGGARR